MQRYLNKNPKRLYENPKIFADKWCLYARQWHHLSFRPTCDHHASIHANSPHHCQRWEGGFSYIQKDKIRMYLFLPNLYCFCNQKEHGRLRALIRAVIHMISVVWVMWAAYFDQYLTIYFPKILLTKLGMEGGGGWTTPGGGGWDCRGPYFGT